MMSKPLIYPHVLLLLCAVSCSSNEQSASQTDAVAERDVARWTANVRSQEAETIAVEPLAAHDPLAVGHPPPERTATKPIRGWVQVEHLPDRIALFDSVFWDARDTVSLRDLIAESDLVKGKSVLEIGTGSGLLSLYCLKFGARKVVATDVNPMAVENARYNAEQMQVGDRFEVRLVPLDDTGAYSVIESSERFDLIISNPPWEDAKPERIADYAFYDPGFALLRSLLSGLPQHLNPDGRALLAFGATDAIRHLSQLSAKDGLSLQILDDRDPEALPDVFVPGMLLEIARRAPD